MVIDRKKASNYLKQLDFRSLFIEELGWDYAANQEISITIDGQDFQLEQIAQKRGMVVYGCKEIPDYGMRTKIDKEAVKYSREHFIIYYDHQMQVWQWVKREHGKPIARREQKVYENQSGEALLQKLDAIAISLAEEERITLPDVTRRTSKVFDVDKVTKKFYDHFKKQHQQFLNLITGFQSQLDQTWYASLMLNRLMFIYFMQKKGFLDGNTNYLQDRLTICQKEYGHDQFYSFYRYFLLKLFHDGLGKQVRTPELERLLGKIPYLNGGLFEAHSLEINNPNIEIPDEAFTAIFAFFNQYDWHLDDRPLRSDKEINPDVLGYIFEQYINNKQMGAYYTKEDITEYISKNCIIPYLFDATQKECAIAFEPEGALWRILRDSPDRYIYEAVRKGVDVVLPEDIAAGIENVSRRDGWNKAASFEYGLPTETWREHVARRTRCLDLRQKLKNGEITHINDLITYNLDIRQFAQDAIANCEGADFLLAFYRGIEKISILDPTCGSGAFLFAALNILEPIYDACLERMQGFIDDCERSNEPKAGKKYQEFRQVLANVAKHPNRRYFILKSIMINNLYGVDIMEEATEICKLRLFLKLVAQVEADPKKPNYGIEPLPDIDFNIRAGNTLVGFASLNQVCESIAKDASGQGKLVFDDTVLNRITKRSTIADQEFKRFRSLQTDGEADGLQIAASKVCLQEHLAELRAELDQYLAEEYELGLSKKAAAFQKWKSSHQPFHWFVEFYGIINAGGFDVIIGNPPWVEYRTKLTYSILNFKTIESNNLWVFTTERSVNLLNKHGLIGLIVPMSLVCTERTISIQKILSTKGTTWLSNYESDSNPGQLFEGVKQNVSILFHALNSSTKQYSTRLQRFFSDGRDYIFPSVEYIDLLSNYIRYGFPKIGSQTERDILEKLFYHSPLIKQMSPSGDLIYVHRIAHYYIKCFNFIPYFRNDRDGVKKSEDYKIYQFNQPVEPFVSLINSSTFYFYWQAFYDGFKAGKYCIETFPCSSFPPFLIKDLTILGKNLVEDMQSKATRITARYSKTGNVEYDQFFPRLSKTIIDEIDRVLAQHYGFTEEELDFIINYDIKYRMGKDNGSDAD
jgi:hypothetical protein